MKLYDFLQLSVCMFSALAAGFWLQSTTRRLPKLSGNTRTGAGSVPVALTSQSRWLAAGAAFAGLAAFAQSVAALLQYVHLD
jgi:hypothetical protein